MGQKKTYDGSTLIFQRKIKKLKREHRLYQRSDYVTLNC